MFNLIIKWKCSSDTVIIFVWNNLRFFQLYNVFFTGINDFHLYDRSYSKRFVFTYKNIPLISIMYIRCPWTRDLICFNLKILSEKIKQWPPPLKNVSYETCDLIFPIHMSLLYSYMSEMKIVISFLIDS